MKCISIQRAALLSACLAAAACLLACANEVEGDESVGSVAQAATAYKLDGKYHYRTDHFSEACSASTLKVRTGWGSFSFTDIPRGDTTYVKPAQAPNGSFEWRCGDVLINGKDYSECDGAPAVWVRFYWSPNSSNIDVQCFERCGDGDSPSDCDDF
jgi:hypothetical protein